MKLVFIFYMCLWVCVFVKHLQTNATNDEIDRRLSLLLELHKNVCGEDFLCKNDSKYWEPSTFRIPVPCCVPCSCLSTCGNHFNCCPALWNNQTATPLSGDRTPPKRRISDNDIAGEENDARTGSKKHTDVSTSPGALTSITGQDESEEEDAVFGHQDTNSSQTILENENDVKAELGHAKSRYIRRKHVANETLFSASADCIRPQVFYKPNNYLDSSAYEMIATCPEWFKDSTIIDKCHAGMDNENLLERIPVTSKLTGLTFTNKYCLECNGVNTNDTSQFHEWQPVIVSDSFSFNRRYFLSPELIVNELASFRSGFDNIHFIPGKDVTTFKCMAYDIIACNKTGLLAIYNETIEDLCRNGPDLPIIHTLGRERFFFKNIACLHCNTDKKVAASDLSCSQRIRMGIPTERYRHSLSLNMRSMNYESEETATAPIHYLDDSRLRLLKQGRCIPGYAQIQGRCRQVICPRDHYLKKNQCVPLYDTITGLDLNVKIQITPNHDITKNIAEEFERILNDTVSYILQNSVSLKVRGIFPFYLPKSKQNPDNYYMFDIYLHNSTEKIKYSQSILDIKLFFTKMKSLELPPLANGLIVGLKIEFTHKVFLNRYRYQDMSNGEDLIPLMNAAWKEMVRRPYIEISDINWCYRTQFSAQEVELLAPFVFQINPSVIVFGTEFDAYFMNVYICIDLVVTQTNNEENVPTRNIDDSFKDKIDEESGETSDKAILLTVCFLITIVLIVIFCKVKAKYEMKRLLTANHPTRNVSTVNDISDLETPEWNIIYFSSSKPKQDEGEASIVSQAITNTKQNEIRKQNLHEHPAIERNQRSLTESNHKGKTPGEPHDETRALTKTSGDQHDETRALSKTSGDPHDETRALSKTSGDETKALSKTSGDETRALSKTSGDQHDETRALSKTSGDQHDETRVMSKTSVDPHDETRAKSGDETRALSKTLGDQHDETRTLSKTSGDQYDETRTLRKTSGDQHDETRALSKTSGDQHDETRAPSKTSGDQHDETRAPSKTSGDQHDETRALSKTSGDQHDETRAPSKTSGDQHDETRALSKTSADQHDET